MLLNYTGTRSFVSHDFRHQRFTFDEKNFFICDVTDNDGARILIETGEYMPIVGNQAEEIKKKAIERKKKADSLTRKDLKEVSKEAKPVKEEKTKEVKETADESVEEEPKEKKKKSKKSAK